MPYEDDSDDRFSARARECFPLDSTYYERIDRVRYVRAREHGLGHYEAIEYVDSVRGMANATNPQRWMEALEESRRCEGCGYDRDDCECYTEEHFADDRDEVLIPLSVRDLYSLTPFANLLNRGGRYYSAEVECNGVAVSDAAHALGCREESYGSKPREECHVIVASDCTCGAEAKLGRLRDGAKGHAKVASDAYYSLQSAGAFCGYNTGHHVHVDATTLTDRGSDAVAEALRASLVFAAACEPALIALAASGYDRHRDPSGHSYAGSLKDSGRALTQRSAWHAANATGYAIHGGGIPTFEYRLPNGTLDPIRGHAHAAIALGLLDLGERYVLRDSAAREYVNRARDRGTYSAPDGAALLTSALDLSQDSKRALHMASLTSGSAPAQMSEALAIAAA